MEAVWCSVVWVWVCFGFVCASVTCAASVVFVYVCGGVWVVVMHGGLAGCEWSSW